MGTNRSSREKHMALLHPFWEPQLTNGSGFRCIATSRFIAGKLLGFYKGNATFRDHTRSSLFLLIEEYARRLQRGNVSERDFEQYAKKFPGSYLTELATNKRKPPLSLRRLWNAHRNPRYARDFREYLLQDAVWNRNAGVSRFPKQTLAEARIYRRWSLGRVPTNTLTQRPKVEEVLTHSFAKANRLLGLGTAMVASVWKGQRHFIVVARIRGENQIWYLDPNEGSRSAGVKALNGTKLYPKATPFGDEGLSPWPNLYYYTINGKLCTLNL